MVCSKNLNFLVNYVHERALEVVHDYHCRSYSKLITAKDEHTIHQHNVNILLEEMYNFKNDLSLPLIDDMFQAGANSFNLRHFQKIANKKKKPDKNQSGDNILLCYLIVESCPRRK